MLERIKNPHNFVVQDLRFRYILKILLKCPNLIRTIDIEKRGLRKALEH